jgi:hypothetical protein
MNNIIKAALAAKFNASDVEALLEVVVATGYPETATEMLLGIYQQPDINLAVHPDYQPEQQNKMFIKFDKWRNRVYYSYLYTRTSTDPDAAAPVPERREDYCSLNAWNNGAKY